MIPQLPVEIRLQEPLPTPALEILRRAVLKAVSTGDAGEAQARLIVRRAYATDAHVLLEDYLSLPPAYLDTPLPGPVRLFNVDAKLARHATYFHAALRELSAYGYDRVVADALEPYVVHHGFQNRVSGVCAALVLAAVTDPRVPASVVRPPPPPPPPPPGVTLTDVAIAPGNALVPPGGTQQFTLTAHYSDGTVQDVTDEAAWGTDDADAATVDKGLASAVTHTIYSVDGEITLASEVGSSVGGSNTRRADYYELTGAGEVFLCVRPKEAAHFPAPLEDWDFDSRLYVSDEGMTTGLYFNDDIEDEAYGGGYWSMVSLPLEPGVRYILEVTPYSRYEYSTLPPYTLTATDVTGADVGANLTKIPRPDSAGPTE